MAFDIREYIREHGEGFKKYIRGLGETFAAFGGTAVIDYLEDLYSKHSLNIDYPYTDITIAAGLVTGYSIAKNKGEKAIAGLTAFGSGLLAEAMKSHDPIDFLQRIGEYAVGTFLSYAITKLFSL